MARGHSSLKKLPAWFLLLTGSAAAVLKDYPEVSGQCLTAGTVAARCITSYIDANTHSKCLCEQAKEVVSGAARCLDNSGPSYIDHIDDILEEACRNSLTPLTIERQKSSALHNGNGQDDISKTIKTSSHWPTPTRTTVSPDTTRTNVKDRRNAREDKTNEKSKGSLSKGALAGIAGGGGIFAAAILGVCGFFIYRRRSRRRGESKEALHVTEEQSGTNTCDEQAFQSPHYHKNTTSLSAQTASLAAGHPYSELPGLPPRMDQNTQEQQSFPVELSSTPMTTFEIEGDSNYQRPVEMPASKTP